MINIPKELKSNLIESVAGGYDLNKYQEKPAIALMKLLAPDIPNLTPGFNPLGAKYMEELISFIETNSDKTSHAIVAATNISANMKNKGVFTLDLVLSRLMNGLPFKGVLHVKTDPRLSVVSTVDMNLDLKPRVPYTVRFAAGQMSDGYGNEVYRVVDVIRDNFTMDPRETIPNSSIIRLDAYREPGIILPGKDNKTPQYEILTRDALMNFIFDKEPNTPNTQQA